MFQRSSINLYDRNGQPIIDWRRWTRPKKDSQWRATRSAMELARAWFTSPIPITPPEIALLLKSHERTRSTDLSEGWPELTTPLPFRGEGRNHDMVLLGNTGVERVLVTVEGKVDETMGPPVGYYWQKSKDSGKSKAWSRVDALLTAVFGPSAVALEAPWRGLPYQMLTAVVGTAIEARKRECALGVVCLHEFITESAKAKEVRQNEQQFENFLRALGVASPVTGQLYGPFDIFPSGDLVPVPILIGKAQYRWADC